MHGTNESKTVDALEQYGCRLNLEIAGVPVEDNENTNGIVVEVAKLANQEITKDQISSSHRLAAKPKRNAIGQAAKSLPPIIVRFRLLAGILETDYELIVKIFEMQI